MKLALQYEMQRPSLDDHKVLTETMEQCILADEVGFDYLWFVEHPLPDRVLSVAVPRPGVRRPQPAGRSRSDSDLGVVILPYPSPEPCCRARGNAWTTCPRAGVDFGTGRSAPYELTGMGIDPRAQQGDVGRVSHHGPQDLGVRLVRVRGQVLAGAVPSDTPQAIPGPASNPSGWPRSSPLLTRSRRPRASAFSRSVRAHRRRSNPTSRPTERT